MPTGGVQFKGIQGREEQKKGVRSQESEETAALSLGAEHVPRLLLDTGRSGGCTLSAPKGRPNKAQAVGP
jgi:hypothetical protein